MKSSRVLWGILLLIAGAVMLGESFGIISDISIFKLFITAILVIIAIKSVFKMEFGGFIFPIAFLFILNRDELGLPDFSTWGLLVAAAFATIGLSLIFEKSIDKRSKELKGRRENTNDAYVNHSTIFGESAKYITSNAFEGADLNCTFGEMKVYFNNTEMTNQNATINVKLAFGEMRLYVPKEWHVDLKVHTLFATSNYENQNGTVITNTLTITGSINFGELSIIYV